MFDFVSYSAETIQVFLLVLMRGSGLFLIAPVFSNSSIPSPVRVGFLILLSGIIVSAIGQAPLPEIVSVWQLAGFAAKEILVGFVIGLMFRLLFMGVKTGGTILGYQLGFAMFTAPDLETSEQVSIISRFWYLLATLIFLAINGHHLVLTALADSYRAIPPGTASMSAPIGEMLIKYTGYIFVVAIKLGVPVIVTLFLTDIALGTIAKMMPTMNVFFVGFPIKIGVGLLVLAMSLPVFSYVLRQALEVFNKELQTVYAAWGGV